MAMCLVVLRSPYVRTSFINMSLQILKLENIQFFVIIRRIAHNALFFMKLHSINGVTHTLDLEEPICQSSIHVL